MLLIIKLSHLSETDRKDLLNKNTGLYPGSQGQPGLRRDLYRELESREAGRQYPTPHLCLLLPICSILPSTAFFTSQSHMAILSLHITVQNNAEADSLCLNRSSSFPGERIWLA